MHAAHTCVECGLPHVWWRCGLALLSTLSSLRCQSPRALTGTFVCSIIIALEAGWKLALVMLALMPLIALAGALIAKVMTSGSAKLAEGYSQANVASSQAITNIRTIASFQVRHPVYTHSTSAHAHHCIHVPHARAMSATSTPPIQTPSQVLYVGGGAIVQEVLRYAGTPKEGADAHLDCRGDRRWHRQLRHLLHVRSFFALKISL